MNLEAVPVEELDRKHWWSRYTEAALEAHHFRISSPGEFVPLTLKLRTSDTKVAFIACCFGRFRRRLNNVEDFGHGLDAQLVAKAASNVGAL